MSNDNNTSYGHDLQLLLASVEASIKEVSGWGHVSDDCTECSECYAQGIEDAVSEFENLVDEIKQIIRADFYNQMVSSRVEVQPNQMSLPFGEIE